MKKLVSLILALAMVLCAVSFASADETYRVAMITDSGDITDQSFNQTTYEACKAFCEANGVDFNYFKPTGDSDAERIAQVEAAIDEGYNVIVMPGYLFAATIGECQPTYPDVKFIALDVSEYDLTSNGVDLSNASNLFSAVYQEELSGYMAGYAAVKMGYKKLGFLGGMEVPAVQRFGYGFVQGANDAAVELGIAADVSCEYVYGGKFMGDADFTAYMDNWYATKGVEVVFACGGGIYTSAAEAAAKVGGKMIGVDSDQSPIINQYADGMTVTSAMKGLAATVKTLLTDTVAGNFDLHAGKVENLGLVSGEDLTLNYVGLPVETTEWNDTFTVDDYTALVKAMVDGKVTVSSDITVRPETTIAVNYNGNIKESHLPGDGNVPRILTRASAGGVLCRAEVFVRIKRIFGAHGESSAAKSAKSMGKTEHQGGNASWRNSAFKRRTKARLMPSKCCISPSAFPASLPMTTSPSSCATAKSTRCWVRTARANRR